MNGLGVVLLVKECFINGISTNTPVAVQAVDSLIMGRDLFMESGLICI